jgi:hypothetical protein
MPEAKPSFLYFALSVIALSLVPAANYAYSHSFQQWHIHIEFLFIHDDLGDYLRNCLYRHIPTQVAKCVVIISNKCDFARV